MLLTLPHATSDCHLILPTDRHLSTLYKYMGTYKYAYAYVG